MPHISLRVTAAVAQQALAANAHQRQIAIVGASPEIRAALHAANTQNMAQVSICTTVQLAAGDTNAFWATHQAQGNPTADFDDLFALLQRRPDTSITFQW